MDDDRYQGYSDEELRKGAAEFVAELERRRTTPEAGAAFRREVEKMPDAEFMRLQRQMRND